MPGMTLEKLHEELNWYSGSVSVAVRTTAFGVMAAIWAMFTAQGLELGHVGLFGIPTQNSIRFAFVFASLTLLADILQYVCAYWMTSICVDRLEDASEKGQDLQLYYNRDCLGGWGILLYRTSFILFPTKMILAILSALSFVALAFGVSWSPS